MNKEDRIVLLIVCVGFILSSGYFYWKVKTIQQTNQQVPNYKVVRCTYIGNNQWDCKHKEQD